MRSGRHLTCYQFLTLLYCTSSYLLRSIANEDFFPLTELMNCLREQKDKHSQDCRVLMNCNLFLAVINNAMIVALLSPQFFMISIPRSIVSITRVVIQTTCSCTIWYRKRGTSNTYTLTLQLPFSFPFDRAGFNDIRLVRITFSSKGF